MKQKRGQLTERVQNKFKELFGRETTQTELRLLPYLQYTMMNSQRLDPNKINGEERKVLSKLKNEKHIFGGASGMRITPDFWRAMNDVLMLAYVDIE